MNSQELLDLLNQAGLDDEAKKELLSECLAALEPKDPEALNKAEEEEQKKAGQLLGVEL